MVCEKLDLHPGDRLLDVGCGWGATAIHAASNYGARVTGITLSEQQAAFGRERVRELGLEDQVRIEVRDYRELGGAPYDAVSSLEMGEHVGADNYPTYAATLHRMVRPGGRVLVQQMSRGDVAPGGGAFIEAFIAPDMHMRPVGATVSLLEEAGLEIESVEAMREHYVRTIAAWHETFESRWDDVRRPRRCRRRPGVAPLPRRLRPGVRAGPDGRRPDPQPASFVTSALKVARSK